MYEVTVHSLTEGPNKERRTLNVYFMIGRKRTQGPELTPDESGDPTCLLVDSVSPTFSDQMGRQTQRQGIAFLLLSHEIASILMFFDSPLIYWPPRPWSRFGCTASNPILSRMLFCSTLLSETGVSNPTNPSFVYART